MAVTLRVCETFVSLMGESGFAGWPAFFIRLSGCNLRCRYCDTRYAYSDGQERTLASLVAEAEDTGFKLVLVTGGEPLLQEECFTLLASLADRGFTVALETNGSRPLVAVDRRVHRVMDLKCPSSGMVAHNYLDNLDDLTAADELKLVVADRRDFDWAVEILTPRRSWERHPVLLSPVFGVLPASELAAWILAARLPWRLNLQLHKYIWPPEARGV